MRKLIQDYPIFFSCFSFLFMSCVSVAGITLLVGATVVVGMERLAVAIEEQDTKEMTDTVYGDPTAQDQILVLNIKGIILNEHPSDPLSSFLYEVTSGEEISSILTDAASDDTVKGIVLNIDSPGGTITGSRAIYDSIKKFKETSNKPVVSYVSGFGASGAYMSAIAADTVIADQGTMVGSIGVIFGPFKEYSNVIAESDGITSVTTLDGIEAYNFYSGEHKDFGFPYKAVPEEVKTQIQKELDIEYDLFVRMVEESRGIPGDQVKSDIKALLYGPTTALDLKLIDKVGNKESAFQEVAQLANTTTDKLNYTQDSQKGFWERLFEESVGRIGRPTATKTCVLCNQMLYLHGDPTYYE